MRKKRKNNLPIRKKEDFPVQVNLDQKPGFRRWFEFLKVQYPDVPYSSIVEYTDILLDKLAEYSMQGYRVSFTKYDEKTNKLELSNLAISIIKNANNRKNSK